MALALGVCLVGPGTVAAAPLGANTEFPVPSAESNPYGITSGPDGNLWLAEQKGDKIARLTTGGVIAEFEVPTAKGRPTGLAPGPDGNVWFTEYGAAKIGRITPVGTIIEYETPTAASGPFRIALGPDGNLWFVELKADKIGRITPGGAITEFELPVAKSEPLDIATGPDGDLWFTEGETNKIGRITPGGTITEFEIPTAASGPEGITTGPEGNVWFTEYFKNNIARVDPAAVSPGTSKGITEFPIPIAESHPEWITAGADGNLWFTETSKNQVARITPAGTISEFEIPTANSDPAGIAPGPDGNLWLTEYNFAGNKVARVGAGAPEPLLSTPVVSGGAQAGAVQSCNVAWATWASLQPSFSTFSFDGYRWFLDGVQVATGQSYTPTSANVGHALSCAETVTYPLPFFVTSSAVSAAVTVVAAPPPPLLPVHLCRCAPLRIFPRITAASESHRIWREGGKLAKITKKRPPVGTTFSFTLNQQANVSFAFTQQVAGRKVGRKCVAQTKANHPKRACSRTLTRGTLPLTGHTGANKVAFQGRLSRSKKLQPGTYTLVIVATNPGGQRSSPRQLTFTILK
jgi:streptogramin lyase